LLGDLNLTSLFRRVDNRSTYRWGLHAYAGAGTLAYKAYSNIPGVMWPNNLDPNKEYEMTNVKFGVGSIFGQVGAGFIFKVNNRIDLELKAMYVVTGDDQFDGSGTEAMSYYANYHPGTNSDNFFTTSVGLTYKIGKHQEHLRWVDPLRELYTAIGEVAALSPNVGNGVCQSGDQDDDGVCDDWDRELDTPKGARVDGAGRALDVDNDGIIDLYDACPTFPGKPNSDPKLNGCPEKVDVEYMLNTELWEKFRGIEFELNKANIRPTSAEFLDNAIKIILQYGEGRKFIVEGHTDSRGTDAYNLALSQRRVESVVKYMEDRGIPRGQLIAVGKGWEGAKWPECKPATICPEWKNEQNRRVVFKLVEDNGETKSSLYDQDGQIVPKN